MLAALPEDSFPLLSDWLPDQGDSLHYSKLKTKILSLFAPTPETRAARILQLAKLRVGTQRASAAYLEMKALTRLQGNDRQRLDLLRALWLQRLPPAVRHGITNFTKFSEDEILELADSLQGSTTSTDDNQACAAKENDGSDDEDIAAVPYSQRRRRRSPAKRRDTPSTKKTTTKDICYYHARFGKEAQNCKPPCIFSKNE